MQATHTFQNKPTDHARGIMKLGIPQPPHYPIGGQASSRKQYECGRHGLSNILKLQATFLYSIYHQRVGKTKLFHMRGGRFHAGNMYLSGLFFALYIQKNLILNIRRSVVNLFSLIPSVYV